MTDVETLLRVDAGERPAGVVLSFERDPHVARRRCMWLATALGIATMAAALHEPSRPELLLVPISCLLSALVVAPSREEEDELRDGKPRVIMMTERGLLVRDPWGIRAWNWAEIAFVTAGVLDGRVQMILRDAGGQSHLVDHLVFDRGEQLYRLIGERVARVREQTRDAQAHAAKTTPAERERKPSSVSAKASA